MVLSDFATTGDGLVAALQVLATIMTEGRPASEVCRCFAPLPQLLRNVRYSSGQPLADPRVLAAVRDAEARLGTKGRLLLRPSGTERLIRVMAEGEDESLVVELVGELCAVIDSVSNLAAAAD
jgi:phosphoglucosamine mutase